MGKSLLLLQFCSSAALYVAFVIVVVFSAVIMFGITFIFVTFNSFIFLHRLKAPREQEARHQRAQHGAWLMGHLGSIQ